MKKSFCILSIVFAVSLSAQQRPAKVPAIPYPIEVSQPNGDKLTIRLHGDERYHFRTTLDGFVIVQDKNGFYCYAKIDKNGFYTPTKTVANNTENRTKKEIKFLKKQIKKEKLYYKLY